MTGQPVLRTVGRRIPRVLEAARDVKARREVARCLAAERPVVVYTAPKTGSTTIETALAEAGIASVKAHFLGLQHERSARRHREAGGALETHHLIERALMRRLPGPDGPRWRIVSLVRDPVARIVSGSFQAPLLSGIDVSDAEATRAHLRRRIGGAAARGRGFQWFDEGLIPIFGVDPADGFDREAGFGLLSGPTADVLLLKMEALDGLGPVISDFVGRPLTLRRENVRGRTADADRYRRVRADLKFPSETLDRIYSLPLARAIYTDAELDAFRARWIG